MISLLAAGHAQGSLIVNGDFEAGNTGFNSGYTFVNPPPRVGFTEYAISTNPNSVHGLWASFGDHTTGSGNMMVVNGAKDPNLVVWSQDVTLTAGTAYRFSVWGTGVHPVTPAKLDITVGGTTLGSLQLTRTLPYWKKLSATFTAAMNGTTTLAIHDLVTSSDSNDFAIDDISLVSLATVPEPSKPTSDLTKNGFVDFDDLAVLLANWNRDGAAPGNLILPDSTPIDFTDLAFLLTEWTGPDPNPPAEAALGAEAVPEPSSLVLALLATLGLSFYRRRRRRAA